jgi:hypothetical protein
MHNNKELPCLESELHVEPPTNTRSVSPQHHFNMWLFFSKKASEIFLVRPLLRGSLTRLRFREFYWLGDRVVVAVLTCVTCGWERSFKILRLETVWQLIKKLTRDLLCDPVVPFQGNYIPRYIPRDLKNIMFTQKCIHKSSVIIHSKQKGETIQISINWRGNVQNILHSYNGILVEL